ncbi:MAG: flagellar hook basal-body protein [Candidatus Melainabacteria bacterium]|nr:flagellar hook basal-body protein [Candidatus Melainabacteria bacterium]
MSISALKSSASTMKGMQSAIDVVAHNIANTNTTAYKEKKVQFSSVVGRGSGQYPQYAGAAVAAIRPNFNQGSLKTSNQITDLALTGKGFFTLQSTTGDVIYTRSGHFSFDGERALVDANGNYVLSSGGSKILLPVTTESMEVTQAGEIRILESGDDSFQVLAQLQLASFANDQALEPIGNSQYRETLNSGTPQYSSAEELGSGTAATQVVSGALEASNADLSANMVDLIAYQRSFQSVSRVTQTANELLEATLALGR